MTGGDDNASEANGKCYTLEMTGGEEMASAASGILVEQSTEWGGARAKIGMNICDCYTRAKLGANFF